MVVNFNSTKYGINPYIPKPEDRPKCTHPECNNRPVAIIGTLKSGEPKYRKYCDLHHKQEIAKRHNVSDAKLLTAKRRGFNDITSYRNSIHPYLKYRLDYCENVDGRLGYECVAHIPWNGILQVDHIDGNPHNHDPSNLQTLCANCHTYKTHTNKDYATPGRKSDPIQCCAATNYKKIDK